MQCMDSVPRIVLRTVFVSLITVLCISLAFWFIVVNQLNAKVFDCDGVFAKVPTEPKSLLNNPASKYRVAYLAEHAQFAYARFCNAYDTTLWPPPKCAEVHVFDRNKGYVLRYSSHATSLLLVVFRGTKSVDDVECDAHTTQRPTRLSGAGKMHSGYKKRAERYFAQLEPILDEYPRDQIYFTGHSMGGAIAIVIANALRRRDATKKRVRPFVVFGCPKLGNSTFVANVGSNLSQDLTIYRNLEDIVPLMPMGNAKNRYADFGSKFDVVEFRKNTGVVQDNHAMTLYLQYVTKQCDCNSLLDSEEFKDPDTTLK